MKTQALILTDSVENGDSIQCFAKAGVSPASANI